jgi:hypothetical protein
MITNISSKQDVFLNSLAFEGKVLSEWIDFFKFDMSSIPEGRILDTFLDKSSEAHYLYGKIKPYSDTVESKLKRDFELDKIKYIESISSDKTKRLPSQEVIDLKVKEGLMTRYEELETIKAIMITFDLIIKKYDSMSYLISKKIN